MGTLADVSGLELQVATQGPSEWKLFLSESECTRSMIDLDMRSTAFLVTVQEVCNTSLKDALRKVGSTRLVRAGLPTGLAQEVLAHAVLRICSTTLRMGSPSQTSFCAS